MRKRYLFAGAAGFVGTAVAARLLARPRDVTWDGERARLGHAERSRFTEVGGVRVHYIEAGAADAPAVVLVHGFAASNFVWHDTLVPLAGAGLRVVAPDLVGFGFSEKPRDGEYTIEAQARAVVRLMDALGIGRATLVGSSYGGAVAAVCALDYPERVRGLVLVGAISNNEVKRRLVARLGSLRGVGEVFAPFVLDARHLSKRRRLRAQTARDGRDYDDLRVRAQLRPLKAANTQRAILRTLRQWDASRVEREAARITQPTLLVWGARDTDVPLRFGERLHALIPGARLFVFETCAHLPQEERPAEFARLVADFCKDRDG
ncbi:MAG TPA: alpha/beta hydrolase [Pyrinomonadaceae bacterium]|nr:alpha/beta hydrolase [Pyrinomonadaceae bacterium]